LFVEFRFSYHFAKYFGVSASIHFGTTSQYKFHPYDPTLDCYDYFPMWKDRIHNLQIPIKLEFHNSIGQSNWFYYGRIGVNLVDVPEALFCSLHHQSVYAQDVCCWLVRIGSYPCRVQLFDANGYKMKIDAQFNLGVYYKLRYNNLIRFGISANLAFQDKFQGFYTYTHQENEYGAMSYRHNHIGLDFAYIHYFKNRQQRQAERDIHSIPFDNKHPIHSASVLYNNALTSFGTVQNCFGQIVPQFQLRYMPSFSIAYNCTFKGGGGFSVGIPLGCMLGYWNINLHNVVPTDTIWSNGTIGSENTDNLYRVRLPYTGLFIRGSYTREIHRNIWSQAELGISFQPFVDKGATINRSFGTPNAYIFGDEIRIPFVTVSNFHCDTRKNWVPNLSGALNFLVHGKNPCHNFVFGLNFNVDFTKRMTIDYATVPSFPSKYQSSGQIALNMTTIGLHVGYQFMTGRREGIGNK